MDVDKPIRNHLAGPAPARGWRRVAWYIMQRRISDLRIEPRSRWEYADKLASFSTIRDIEQGRRDDYGDDMLHKIERDLHWAPGSIRRVLDGGTPEALPAEPSPEEWAIAAQREGRITHEQLVEWLRIWWEIRQAPEPSQAGTQQAV